MDAFSSIDEIIAMLRLLGTMESSESNEFSELEHGLQTTALLVAVAPDDDELLVAGLVHDIAHPWDGPGQPKHAVMGADAVRHVLGERVASLVAGHVPAKRWLVTNDPAYQGQLSADSVTTLAAQGGVMSADEVRSFESLDDWRCMIDLRRADDGAKVPGARIPGLDAWLGALHRVASRSRP